MSLIEGFKVNDFAVDEWLPWGGLTRPSIMEQKDHSLFSVISYLPWDEEFLNEEIDFPEFCRGWGFWSERQHTLTEDKNYLALFWNPFTSKTAKFIENTLGEKVYKQDYLAYFEHITENFTKMIRRLTTARLISYQEIYDYLTFSLSMGDFHIKMESDPFQLDALLSQDIPFEFTANDIYIFGKRVLILTLPTLPKPDILFERFAKIPYRYVRRLLIFSREEAEKDMKKYSGSWCPGRKTMLKRIEQDIIGKLNGYCHNGFIFHVPLGEYENFRSFVKNTLYDLELPGLIEEYNLKDVWWGSITGTYLANITPPLIGFSSVKDLLVKKPKKPKEERKQFQDVIDAISQGGDRENV